MFCQNCGKPIPDGANFCSGCGAAVPAREQQAPPRSWRRRQLPSPPLPDLFRSLCRRPFRSRRPRRPRRR
ncbi:MAG: zinc ribbon domain-containing protein [Oscillibacter sp.]|nr:zinc ribbon domain-containing protein [Oscillibacter sp.]